MRKIVLAVLLVNASALLYSQGEAPSQELEAGERVVTEVPVVPESKVDDSTVLSEEEKNLPDSLRQAKEFQLMRSLNPKDSLLEDKKVPEKRFITIGFTVGPTFSTYGLAGMNGSTAGWGPGVQLGINCDLPFGQKPVGQYFSIQPELLFSYRHVPMELVGFFPDGGHDLEGEPTGSYEKYDATDDVIYMNVPINVKASARYKKGRAFVSLAPMISLGLYGNRTVDGLSTLLFQSDADEQREEPMYNNFDFSFYPRLGYDSDKGLSVSVGFQMGFINMQKASGEGVIKNRSLSLNVGYNF
ncbi:MAG: outer membrane beta-barrel protein [Paludibacteraceae bacterium]|nr:outer membrane beta-barrel protein [Paludibacteraceae bacterium]